MAMVRIFFGSLERTPLPSAAGALPCACGGGAAAGLSFISTRCSLRDTRLLCCAWSATRSVISLLGALLAVTGTILLGAISALITGGGWLGPDVANSAR